MRSSVAGVCETEQGNAPNKAIPSEMRRRILRPGAGSFGPLLAVSPA